MKKVKAAFRGICNFPSLRNLRSIRYSGCLLHPSKKQAEWSEKPAYALNDGFLFPELF